MHYIKLTKEVMPKMASKKGLLWPVIYDHCFQHILLDTICNGSWHDSPFTVCLQAFKAVQVCEGITAGCADLNAFNRQSLLWRNRNVRSKNC